MEVRLNTGLAAAGPVSGARKPVPTTAPPADGVELSHARALEQAVSRVPAVRTEAVARGEQLASNPSYPPPEIIRRISSLLALNLNRPAEGAADNAE